MRAGWRSVTSRFLVVAVAASIASGGCTLKHWAATPPDFLVTADSIDRPYEALGMVHAEAWTAAYLYHYSIYPSLDLEDAQDYLLEEARSKGADAVVNAEVYVETHMFGFVIGYIEYHMSGMAIRYKKRSDSNN